MAFLAVCFVTALGILLNLLEMDILEGKSYRMILYINQKPRLLSHSMSGLVGNELHKNLLLSMLDRDVVEYD